MANLYTNNRGTAAGLPATGGDVKVLSEYIDFSATTNIATDVFQVLNIPAGSMVVSAGIDIVVADTAGNSGTIALGDGTVAYVTAATIAGTGSMTSGDALAELAVTYDAADTLDITVAVGAVNAEIRVWAVVADITSPNATQYVTFAV